MVQTVLHITGCLEFSDPVRTVTNCFGHALESVVEHNLEHEVLTGEEVNKRFPGWRLPPHYKVASCAPTYLTTNCGSCAIASSVSVFSEHMTRWTAQYLYVHMWQIYGPQGCSLFKVIIFALLESPHSEKPPLLPVGIRSLRRGHRSYLCHITGRVWQGPLIM